MIRVGLTLPDEQPKRDYATMTRNALIALCEQKGIEFPPRANKGALIELLELAEG